MKILKPKQTNGPERGIISLTTTIIISILLAIIVISMVSLMVGELRQAEDSDQSIRAYYAAEAGLEDALLKVQAGTLNQSCSGAPASQVGSDPAVAWTCQQITTSDSQLSGRRNKEEAVQFEPNGASPPPFAKVKISWHQKGSDPDLPNPYSIPANPSTGDTWTYPALLEMTVLSIANPAAITPANPVDPNGVKVQNVVIYPSSGAASFSPQAISGARLNGACTAANVAATGGYYCYIEVSMPANARVIRLRPRYTGSNYKVEFFDSVGAKLQTGDQTATIDITAKAGSVYRRIQAGVPIKAGTATGLDYVLFSDTDICKDFQVSGGVATGNSGCNGL